MLSTFKVGHDETIVVSMRKAHIAFIGISRACRMRTSPGLMSFLNPLSLDQSLLRVLLFTGTAPKSKKGLLCTLHEVFGTGSHRAYFDTVAQRGKPCCTGNSNCYARCQDTEMAFASDISRTLAIHQGLLVGEANRRD